MANLFFIHTPFQLFVAQQIIYHEKMEGDNVMIYGYNGNHREYLRIFDLMVIDGFWKNKFYLDKIDHWAYISFSDIHSFGRLNSNIHFIKGVIEKENIDSIYLGDIDSYTHLFCTLLFHKEKNIVFFEEGSSHYTFKDHVPERNPIKLLYSHLADYLYYIPRFGFSFTNYYRHLSPSKIEKYISKRYSIIPGINSQPYDVTLPVTRVISDGVMKYIESQSLDKLKGRDIILLLSTDVYVGDRQAERYHCYLDSIKNYISSLPKGSTILLKLHPNETNQIEEDLCKLLIEKDMNCCTISSEINIPVEYYLQYLNVSVIVHFMSSTIFYNGYIFEPCRTKNLFLDFFEKCKAKGINMNNLNGLYKAAIRLDEK